MKVAAEESDFITRAREKLSKEINSQKQKITKEALVEKIALIQRNLLVRTEQHINGSYKKSIVNIEGNKKPSHISEQTQEIFQRSVISQA